VIGNGANLRGDGSARIEFLLACGRFATPDRMCSGEVLDRLAISPRFENSLGGSERIRRIGSELEVVVGASGGEVAQHEAEHVSVPTTAETVEEAPSIEPQGRRPVARFARHHEGGRASLVPGCR